MILLFVVITVSVIMYQNQLVIKTSWLDHLTLEHDVEELIDNSNINDELVLNLKDNVQNFVDNRGQ